MNSFSAAITQLIDTFETFPTVTYALIVGIFIAVCSSLLGVTLVLKRFSFIGDGLSHVAFGAMTFATVLGFLDNTYITLGLTIFFAVLLLRTNQNAKIKGDAAIAMISVGSLALGYLIINIATKLNIYTGNLSGDVCSTLFGSMAFTLIQRDEAILCIVLSLIVILAFIFLYNKIFAVTFDEDFANATGTNANTYNLILAILIAIIVVISMKFVGSLLISALVIFPALSAMRIFKSFFSVTVFSVILSTFCTTLGFILSIMYSTPAGSTIVAVDIIAFSVCFVIGKLAGGNK